MSFHETTVCITNINFITFLIHLVLKLLIRNCQDANTNQPLIGVTIQLDDGKGAVTNSNGKYLLNQKKKSKILLFLMLGMKLKLLR